jgi:Zn ribbon nucleic-acid-binding protein
MPAGNCPICNSSSELQLYVSESLHHVRCRRCGEYAIFDFTKDHIELALQLDNTGIDRYLTMEDGQIIVPRLCWLSRSPKRQPTAGH